MKVLFSTLYDKEKIGATKKLRPWLDKADEAFNAIKKKFKKGCTGARCFSGDTLVYTSKGYQPIKEIQEGDDVFSRNPETGEVGFKEVEEIFQMGQSYLKERKKQLERKLLIKDLFQMYQ